MIEFITLSVSVKYRARIPFWPKTALRLWSPSGLSSERDATEGAYPAGEPRWGRAEEITLESGQGSIGGLSHESIA